MKAFWRDRGWVFGLSLLLYALACASPALEFVPSADGPQVARGLNLLALGWLGVLVLQFAWLANPLLWLAWTLLLLRRRRGAALCAGLALVVATDTLRLFHTPLPADISGGNHQQLQALAIGFWLWLASMAVVPLAALLRPAAAESPPAPSSRE
ncbi:MAG TPA: hypothetical protein VNN09_08165 [Candidatus Competibacteraceae bacterium]|nr:hypothetical protein [Candidatus Competibacteraceae bacterium]